MAVRHSVHRALHMLYLIIRLSLGFAVSFRLVWREVVSTEEKLRVVVKGRRTTRYSHVVKGV